MRAILAASQRHPQVVDAVFAVLLAALFARLAVQDSICGWAWLAAIHLPVVCRRRWPVTVLGVVVVLAFAATASGFLAPSLIVVPMVAAYAVARYRPRRLLWVVAAPVLPFVADWWWHTGPSWDPITAVAIYVVAALLGSDVQTRRAYLAGLENRAYQLEKEREQQAQLAVAAERTRISREMHDIVAHNLAVMVALADGAVASTPAEPRRGMDLMRQVSVTGREALGEIRRLVGLLRDGDVNGRESGGIAPPPDFGDLDELVEQVRAAGLPVTLTRDGTPDGWGPGAGLAVYRIVQEALTNTMKHAGPEAHAEVRLRFQQTGIDVEIANSGDVPGVSAGGHGVTGMTERAAAYGGRLEAGPQPGGGWRVYTRLPFAAGKVA